MPPRSLGHSVVKRSGRVPRSSTGAAAERRIPGSEACFSGSWQNQVAVNELSLNYHSKNQWQIIRFLDYGSFIQVP